MSILNYRLRVFSLQILIEHSVIVTDTAVYQTPRSAAYDMGMHCLRVSHKKDATFIWAKRYTVKS